MEDETGWKGYERIIQEYDKYVRQEGNRKPVRSPSQATRKITPDAFDSPARYVWQKMGALLGASKQWLRLDEIEELTEKRREKAARIRKRIEDGDEKAIFDYIRHDSKNLCDQLVQKRIYEWQNLILSSEPEKRKRYRKRLQKIGECLIPNMKGVRRNTIDSQEEVLKYYWGREWRWYHLDVYLKDRDWLTMSNKTLEEEFTKKCKEYGLSKERTKKILESLFKNETNPLSTSIAAYETAEHFCIDEQTVLNLISKYE